MSINASTILGYIAGTLIIISYFIQIFTMLKTKDVKGLSLIYLVLFFFVAILYATSGFLDDIQYLYYINMVCTCQTLFMVILKVYYDRKTNLTTMDNPYQNL